MQYIELPVASSVVVYRSEGKLCISEGVLYGRMNSVVSATKHRIHRETLV